MTTTTDGTAQLPHVTMTAPGDILLAAKKPLTHVVIVLDRSGSMGSIWRAMQQALDAQLQNLRAKKKQQRLRLWFAVFDDQYALLHQASKLKDVDVPGLMQQHGPRGSTALYDALSDTVLLVEREVPDPDCAFLCIIVTDGYENASKRVTGPQLRDTLERLQRTDRWTFVYLGANQDITAVTQATGIARGGTMSYDSTDAGVVTALGSNSPTSRAMDSYFSGRERGATATPDFYGPDAEKPDDDAGS